jgi:hypothetical protein
LPGHVLYGSSMKSTVSVDGHSMLKIWLSEILPLSVMVVVLTAALAWAFIDYLDMPIVHVSARTHECVRVEHADGTAGSCAHLPSRYVQQWAP